MRSLLGDAARLLVDPRRWCCCPPPLAPPPPPPRERFLDGDCERAAGLVDLLVAAAAEDESVLVAAGLPSGGGDAGLAMCDNGSEAVRARACSSRAPQATWTLGGLSEMRECGFDCKVCTAPMSSQGEERRRSETCRGRVGCREQRARHRESRGVRGRRQSSIWSQPVYLPARSAVAMRARVEGQQRGKGDVPRQSDAFLSYAAVRVGVTGEDESCT